MAVTVMPSPHTQRASLDLLALGDGIDLDIVGNSVALAAQVDDTILGLSLDLHAGKLIGIIGSDLAVLLTGGGVQNLVLSIRIGDNVQQNIGLQDIAAGIAVLQLPPPS